MINLRKSIEEAANGEAIEACVVGTHNDRRQVEAFPVNVVLPWADVAPFLDYEYDNGYGGAGCHPVYAWTASRVIFVHEYDGATRPYWVPRHAVNIVPMFSGES